uniref:Uncharacterized protein n=1 Tax=Neosartorya fischeri (strain ATCC 1020 / DSM 3700 / CBS 544.65 / FGSC A1164 / JCM 1740 / NRRL 181 / WB 181) TaxID=331117 RepID=H9CNP8_NEOFI|nr:hypothetical protein NFIA_m0390 [Aspergillus fischeri]
MYYQSIQFNPFHLVSPSLFSKGLLFYNDLFVGLQNILSSFIDSNLWYYYLFLIFIFSILLTILLFILVIQTQKGYSVKMNNLPKNENSKKRKRKSENGDSGSPKESKPKLFFPKEDEDTNSYRHYMVKYDSYVRDEISFDPIGTRKQVEDTFPSLYSEYKKHKVNNPDLEWGKLTDIYYCTWNKRPFGSYKYSGDDQGFAAVFEYMERRKALVESGRVKGNLPMASSMCKKAWGNIDFTTYEKYIKIIDNVANKIGK